ncbi:MAG: hypothetical protein WAO58_00020 [Fimbriimonadaceae bacterium]
MAMSMKACPTCGTNAPLDAGFCQKCGHQFRTSFSGQDRTQAFQQMSPPPVGGYPYPADQQRTGNEGFAIASMVLGIIGVITSFWCFGVIPSILAVVFANSGMRSANRGMAIAGQVTGWVGIAIGIVFTILFLVAMSQSPYRYRY